MRSSVWDTVSKLEARGKPCPYCGIIMERPTIDHVFPKSRYSHSSKLPVCRRCNLDKGDRNPFEWFEKLKESKDVRVRFVRRHLRKLTRK